MTRVFLVSIIACGLVLAPAGCHRSSSTTPAGSLAGPMNSKERMRAEQWERATHGLSFDLDAGHVEVALIASDNARSAAREIARGDELLSSNLPMEAIEAYALAARHDPQRAEAFVGLGVALARKGKPDFAIAALRTAVDLDGEYDTARFELAMMLWTAGKLGDAVEEMKAVLAINENHGEAHERLAIWSYYAGDLEQAWRHVHRATALGQDLPTHFVRLLEEQMPEPTAE